MKLKNLIPICAGLLLATQFVIAKDKPKGCPIAQKGEKWSLNTTFSDEFESDVVDNNKWTTDMAGWGIRSWSEDCVKAEDGKLKLSMRYEEHQSKGEKFFYKMGIAISKETTTYGYFEAKIKGASLFPGVCPAFWLFSRGESMMVNGEKITYSEIDIIELTMGEAEGSTVRTLDTNLHMRKIDENGEEIWQRPNTHPELCKTAVEAEWDPRDDFHIYACENRPDSIVFYVDNKRIGAKKNHYWHLPMNLTFTMEPRKPHHEYSDGGRIPVPEAATREGFPTTMEVEWVRTWVKE